MERKERKATLIPLVILAALAFIGLATLAYLNAAASEPTIMTPGPIESPMPLLEMPSAAS
jgi:hypothetical protein